MVRRISKTWWVAAVLLLLSGWSSLKALTIEELRDVPNPTPKNVASYFADFKFVFHAEVQDPNVFLGTKSGDCDDYAIVVVDVLGRHGYTTHLIAIRMKGETHVVCYIDEVHGYLDYNCRKDENPVVDCNNSIVDIARKVAQSFNRDWVATYEFSYSQGTKRLVNNIVPNKSAKTS